MAKVSTMFVIHFWTVTVRTHKPCVCVCVHTKMVAFNIMQRELLISRRYRLRIEYVNRMLWNRSIEQQFSVSLIIAINHNENVFSILRLCAILWVPNVAEETIHLSGLFWRPKSFR